MNPITMKLVVDDLILQALREDITFEDVSTASVCPTARPATVGLSPRPMASSFAGLDVFARNFERWIWAEAWCRLDVVDGDEVHAGDHGQVRGDRARAAFWRARGTQLPAAHGIAGLHAQHGCGARGHQDRARRHAQDPHAGMRVFEKAAVEIGGGSNHRYNLSTVVMLKDTTCHFQPPVA